MASVAQIGPGRYRLLCDCGYEKREVTDSEVYFKCERPCPEAKDKPCPNTYYLPKLVAEYEASEERRKAMAFVANHGEMLRQAEEVLRRTPVATSNPAPELKLVEKPKRKKKETEHGG